MRLKTYHDQIDGITPYFKEKQSVFAKVGKLFDGRRLVLLVFFFFHSNILDGSSFSEVTLKMYAQNYP